MNLRLPLAVMIAAVLMVTHFGVAAHVQAEKTLDIGSTAPALDIDTYLSDGDGAYPEVTELEEGKVYLIEFFATWCGPCIQSMPSLVDLQTKHAEDDFQIVSVSSEPLETVEGLMGQPYPGTDKTFAELTSAYTVTVDPDGSVQKDYMVAAEQNGIPAAFLVGRTGLIEWIGHPMAAEEPIAQVIAGTWDREAFKEELRRQELFELAMIKANRLAGSGDFEDALKVLDKTVEELKANGGKVNEMMLAQINTLRFNLRLDSGDQSEEVLAYFRGQLAAAQPDARDTLRFAFNLMEMMQQGTDVGPLSDETLAVLDESADDAPENFKPLFFVLMADINASLGKFDAAIAAQQRGVEATTGRQKERMQEALEELKKMAADAAK